MSNLAVYADRFEADGVVTVSVDVTNTGGRSGSDVVHIYVSDPEASLQRPEKELKGFAKMTLAPGETRNVSVTLNARAFAFYSPIAQHWLVEKGTFTIKAARHSMAHGLAVELSRQTTLMLPV